MAAIHKRKLRNGHVVWELTHGTGHDRQRFVVGPTREQAQEALKQFERQLALHGQAPTDDSIDSALGQYLTFIKANRRRSTVRRYARVLTTFHRCFLAVHHFDLTRLRQVRPAHIEEYKTRRLDGSLREATDEDVGNREEQLRQEVASRPRAAQPRDNAKFGWLGRKRFRPTISPRTINYELRVVGTFLAWATAKNLLFVNPAAGIQRLRVPKRAIPKFLTIDELQKLLASCTDGERRLFTTVLLTGMRKGEIEHLTWRDVNFHMGVILIQAKPEWSWQPKTDERVIPISPQLRDVLTIQYAQRLNDGLVFPNKAGNRDTHILEKLKKLGRRAGIDANVHSLRHSFGAHLRMAGVSLSDIGDLLGHKDLATTQIYAKVHQQHLRTAIDKLSPIVAEVVDAPSGDVDGGPAAEGARHGRTLLKR